MKKLITCVLLALPAIAQIAPQVPVFYGTGLNDLTSSGIASNAAGPHVFQIKISATGTPDHFEWVEDGGSYSSPIAITGAAQALAGGVSVRFAATTGHTLSTAGVNIWTVSVVVSGSSASQNFIQRGAGAQFRDVQSKLREIVSVNDYGASALATPAVNYTAFVEALSACPQSTGALPTTISGQLIRGCELRVAAASTPYVISAPLLIGPGVALRGVAGANGGSPNFTIQLEAGVATSGPEVFTVTVDPTNDSGASPNEVFGQVFENVAIDCNGGVFYGNNTSASGLLFYGAQGSKLDNVMVLNCGVRGLVIGANGGNGSGFFDARQVYVAGVTQGPGLRVDSNVGTLGNISVISVNPAGAYGVPDSPVFVGVGLNDATSGGADATLGGASHTYVVTISATGTPDHFTWTVDGGSASSPVAITGAAQTLSNGVTITFAVTTGHTSADQWTIQLDPNPAVLVTGIQNSFDNVTVEQSWLGGALTGALATHITNWQATPSGAGRPIGLLIKHGSIQTTVAHGINFAGAPNIYANALVDRTVPYSIAGVAIAPFAYSQTEGTTVISGGLTIAIPQSNNTQGLFIRNQYTNAVGVVVNCDWALLPLLASGTSPGFDILTLKPPQPGCGASSYAWVFAGPLGDATAISGNYSSVISEWQGTYWNGAAEAAPTVSTQFVVGTGTSPTFTLLTQGPSGIIIQQPATVFDTATPTTSLSGGQVALGNSTAAASFCGSFPGAAGCLLAGVGGAAEYIPYWPAGAGANGFTGTKTRTACTTITGGVPTGCANVTETYVNGLLQ